MELVEQKLKAWKMEHSSIKWHEALLEIALTINTQIHSPTSRTPYSIVFRHPINFKSWIPYEETEEMLSDGELLKFMQEDITNCC